MKKFLYFLYIAVFRFTPEDYRPYSLCFPWIRSFLVRKFVIKAGRQIRVKYNADISMRIEIGDRSELGQRCLIHGDVCIGSDVIMGPDVKIYSRNHNFSDLKVPIKDQGKTQKFTKIGDNVWLGANAIILPGVEVSDGCVIAAGSVVTRSTIKNGVYAGVPAKLKFNRDKND